MPYPPHHGAAFAPPIGGPPGPPGASGFSGGGGGGGGGHGGGGSGSGGFFPRASGGARGPPPPPPPPPATSAPAAGGGSGGGSHGKGGMEKRGKESEAEAQRRREKRKLDEKERAQDAKRRAAEREKADKERNRLLELIPQSSDVAGATKKLEMGEFVAPFKFSFQMPALPSDPKLVDIPFDVETFVQFRYDSMAEQSTKYEMQPEPDLGITIDLVDPQAYEAPPGATLDAKDAELLSSHAFALATGEKRSASAGAKSLRQGVAWLRKTPLLGNNLYDSVHKYTKQPIERQATVSQTTDLALRGDTVETLEQQILNIDKSFDDAEGLSVASLRHPTNDKLTAVNIMPVLPDEACWENSYVQATFDVDPSLATPGEIEATFPRERVARALIKQMRNEEGRPFLAYMLPPAAGGEGEEGVEEEAEPDEAIELEYVRDYTFEAGNLPEGHTYFLAVGDDAAVYNAIEGRIGLTRGTFMGKAARPSRITLARRALDEAEQDEHERRLAMLVKPPQRMLLVDKSAADDGPPPVDKGGEQPAEQPLLQDADAAEGGAADGGASDGDDDPFGGADGGGGGEEDEAGGRGDVLLGDDDDDDDDE
jgi:RNA polymerase II-associated factor 1